MRRLTRLKAAMLLALAPGLALAACSSGSGGSSGSSGSSTSASSPFTVVVVAPMSGQLAAYGAFTKAAYLASVKTVNARGGILGHKVVATILDDQGNPTTGVSALQAYLSSHPKPDLVYPGAASPEVQGTAPYLASQGILTVSAAALPSMDDPSKYPLYFSTNTHNTASLTQIVDYVKAHGYTRVGIISSDDTIGDQITTGMAAATKGTGLTVSTVLFPPTALNVTPEVEKLKADNPQVVIMDAVGPLTLLVLNARQSIGWSIPFIGGVNSGGADFSQVSSAALKNVFVTVYAIQQYVAPAQRTVAFNSFYSAVKSEGPLVYSTFYYAVDYDPLQVVSVAAAQAKSLDPQKIAAALQDLKQPASPPWVLFKDEGYSTTTHLNTSTTGDYAIVPATPLNQGFTGGTGASS
jgi:branched-chain amino acid transport system substrate-binding protein